MRQPAACRSSWASSGSGFGALSKTSDRHTHVAWDLGRSAIRTMGQAGGGGGSAGRDLEERTEELSDCQGAGIYDGAAVGGGRIAETFSRRLFHPSPGKCPQPAAVRWPGTPCSGRLSLEKQAAGAIAQFQPGTAGTSLRIFAAQISAALARAFQQERRAGRERPGAENAGEIWRRIHGEGNVVTGLTTCCASRMTRLPGSTDAQQFCRCFGLSRRLDLVGFSFSLPRNGSLPREMVPGAQQRADRAF
jgi:hypothetical protein